MMGILEHFCVLKNVIVSTQIRTKILFYQVKKLCYKFPIIEKLILLNVFILFSINAAQATITIQSVATNISTCGNNGVATIIATSNKPNSTLFYELISGPFTSPVQNTPIFTSLYPGTYTARVYDIDFLFKDQEFTINGNYQLPDLNPQVTTPFCLGGSTGIIRGGAVLGTGKSPFIWELTTPNTSIKQTSDIFNNLPAANYSIKITDACGNYQTRTVILGDKGTGLSHASNGIPSISKIGCDSMLYSMDIRLSKERAKNPLILTLDRGNGILESKTIYPIPVDTVNYIPALYSIRDTIINISYGDYLHGCLKDVCGYEICATKDLIAPFDFDIKFTTTYEKCSYTQIGTVLNKSLAGSPYMRTAFQSPLSLTFYDVATNTLIDSTGCNRSFCSLILTKGISGKNYKIHLTDGCGKLFEETIQWPDPIIEPEIVKISVDRGCLDSSAVVRFGLGNFGAPVTIQILSGPDQVFSTKVGYTYSYGISYPKTFFANQSSQYSIKNLAVGTYSYIVTDTCGKIITGTFEVKPSNVNDLFYSYSLANGCAGDNILKFNPINSNAVGIIITKLSTNTDIYKRTGSLIRDSLSSLEAGKYLIEITYGASYNATITDEVRDCWVLTDTIEIPDNSTNTDFQSHTSIFCNGIHYVEINADSTHGLPPYQYEISDGPARFPLQSSNVFQLPIYGEYIIRIRDACGNSNVRQISVDSAKFAPIIKVGASCRGNRIALKAITSSFFEYDWNRPNGSIFTGDSLIIQNLSPADTGMYVITKKVNINGCTDTFKSTYHIELRDVYPQSIDFCEGSAITIGTHIFTTSSVYTDTLQNKEGCDSIRVITLNMLPKKIDTVNVRICNGDDILIGGTVYNKPGIYKDSIQNTFGCYEITATKLEVNGYPDTIRTTICEGENFSISNHTYSIPGFYTDTLRSSFGCDSVIITNLIVLPLKRNTIIKSICTGETITIGKHIYNQTGIYYDTLATLGCDSIVTLNLTVHKAFPVLSTHDTSHCFDEGPAIITANAAQSFLWMPSGETTQSIEVTQAGTYSVTATDVNMCSYTEQITVREFCETKLFVPTGFTPNGDGLHDDVEIFGKHFTDFRITIFNRWGEIIFISTDRNIRWDGTYRGELMPAGSYPWIITYKSTLDPEHKEHALKGSITLVR